MKKFAYAGQRFGQPKEGDQVKGSGVGESDKEQTIATCIHEIAETLAVLESNLPRQIDGFALSHKSKMPWKVLLYREALIWRMVELSKRAFESFTSDQLVCGIVLTRAVLEVSAALWFLCAKVEAVVDSKVVGDVDEYLMKPATGNATGWPENSAPGAGAVPRPVKVGKMLEQAEKDIEGFSHQYGVLSEYAHPNRAGTVLLYSDTDQQTAITDLSPRRQHGSYRNEIPPNSNGKSRSGDRRCLNGTRPCFRKWINTSVTRDLSQRVLYHHKLPRSGVLAQNNFRLITNAFDPQLIEVFL
jgi:hypothetical protein